MIRWFCNMPPCDFGDPRDIVQTFADQCQPIRTESEDNMLGRGFAFQFLLFGDLEGRPARSVLTCEV